MNKHGPGHVLYVDLINSTIALHSRIRSHTCLFVRFQADDANGADVTNKPSIDRAVE